MTRPLPLTFRPMAREQAEAILQWTYSPPYDVYNLSPEEAGRLMAEDARYFAAFREEEFVGFCCFGTEARVPGLEAEPDVADIGAGLRPDLVGRGIGARFLASVVQFATEQEPGVTLRVCIAAFNQRAQRAAEAVGFTHVGELRSGDRQFVLLERRPERSSDPQG